MSLGGRARPGYFAARRRADVGQARSEGRPLLRRRAACHDSSAKFRRAQPPPRPDQFPPPRPAARPARRRCSNIWPRSQTLAQRLMAGPGTEHSAWTRRVLRRSLHGRAAHAVPHLQLSAPTAAIPALSELRRRRAHRLWTAHDPAAGRTPAAWKCASRSQWVARNPACAWLLRVQHRRHARPHDPRSFPVSTPHRIREDAGPRAHGCRCRSSSTPGFFTKVATDRAAAPAGPAHDDAAQHWDKTSVHGFQGTYGDYLLGKVGKVFPQLRRALQPGAAASGQARLDIALAQVMRDLRRRCRSPGQRVLPPACR